VRDLATETIVGSTRYHDIMTSADRVEIGYTWYAASRQRSHVNSACKLRLMTHAFETLGCQVVGFRTDNFNFRSQRAIEALGAKKDGVLRHHFRRRDGSVRDSVMYSVLLSEWPARPKAVIHSAASTSAGGSLEARRAGMKVARTTETSSRQALAR
jgi:RimJ/RimL family protein N-acetyltransferase